MKMRLGIKMIIFLALATDMFGQVALADLWTPDLHRAPVAGDEYINPVDGSVLVWIQGGEFMMGADEFDNDSKPRHKIVVEGFWIGKYEVTVEQYLKYIRAIKGKETPYLSDENRTKPNLPIYGIRFKEAKKYMEWALLRLPTEAEWEYAAAGGSRQLEFPTNDGNISHDTANYWGSGGNDKWLEEVAPVGSFLPNPLGLYDMAGNVWEWTNSLYYNYPYNKRDGRESMDTDYQRVMRGGGWMFPIEYCRTTYRHHFAMHLRYDFVGMRVASSAIPWWTKK